MRTCPWSWQRTWQFLEGKGLRASNSPIQNCDCSSRCECSWPGRFSKIRTGSHSAAENRVRASLHSSGLQTCGCAGPGWQQEVDVRRFFNGNLLWAPTGPVTSSLKSPRGARPTVDHPSAASPVLRDGGRVPPLNLGSPDWWADVLGRVVSQGVRVRRAAGAGDVVLHLGTNLPGTTAFWLAKKQVIYLLGLCWGWGRGDDYRAMFPQMHPWPWEEGWSRDLLRPLSPRVCHQGWKCGEFPMGKGAARKKKVNCKRKN